MPPTPNFFYQPRGSRITGFTLIEMMVVVAILAILAAIATPQFRDVIDRYRVRRANEDLIASIYLARTEAIKRGGNVALAKMSSGSGCAIISTQDWSCGWAVFVDVNGNKKLDAGDQILQTSPVPNGVDVMLFQGSSGGPASMQADRWGQFNGLGAFSFNLQPSENAKVDLTMGLCMSSGGRLRTVKGAEVCS